jgi:hypothetical protein
MMEQDRQFPGDGNHSSLFGVLASAFCELEAPTAKIAVRTERPEHVLSGTNKQSTQVAVSGLGDAQLRVLIAGLITPGDEAQRRTNFSALFGSVRAFQALG